MEFYYIENSGFLLRQSKELVLIDCMKALPEQIAGLFDETYALTVLVSHFHGDHFSPRIFKLRDRWPNVQYILSSDVLVHRKRDIPKQGPIQYISKGRRLSVNGVHVTAWGSTDEGVSFHIEWGGAQIFHAGDLNCWHWKEESTPEAVREAIDWFERELEEISNHVPPLDVAFFPVDPRMGDDYYRGAVRFAQVMRPKQFVPMHFGAALNPPQAFFDEMKPLTQVIRTPSFMEL
jgi:L-ascorbate metabolism protein UlaG (beta-lactamase superfamily)